MVFSIGIEDEAELEELYESRIRPKALEGIENSKRDSGHNTQG